MPVGRKPTAVEEDEEVGSAEARLSPEEMNDALGDLLADLQDDEVPTCSPHEDPINMGI